MSSHTTERVLASTWTTDPTACEALLAIAELQQNVVQLQLQVEQLRACCKSNDAE